MRTLHTVSAMRKALEPYRAGTVGLVPTMGALHEGHRSLFAAARGECDIVVASVFVNHAQFGEGEDFAAYPRNAARDERVAEDEGVDFLFAPSAAEMYPDGFQTWVEVEELSGPLEGRFRPDHFRGVATVCLKLFNIVRPQRAYFGQKDAQQAAVVEQLVRDLDLEVAIRVRPTVRDADGLAVSSRNAYLTPEERRRARALPRALAGGAAAYREGRDPVAAARALLDGLEPDYLSMVQFRDQTILAAAVRLGRARLIDNVVLDKEAT